MDTSPPPEPASRRPTRSTAGRGKARPLALGLAAAGLVIFGLAQLVPIRVTNPPARVEPRWDSPQTRQLVAAACFDCHSNQSRHFWYEDIAPIKWWTANHVSDGRRALNFDEWDKAQRRAARASRVVARNSMPPSYYTWLGLHPDAKLSATARQALIAGLDKTLAADPPRGPSGGDGTVGDG